MERRESFRERRKRQQARRRLLGKLAAVLIGAVFLFGLCKKTADQFLLTDEKKQDSYIGIEDAGHMVWLLADCRQGQMTQAPAETTDVARDNTQAAAVSAHTAGSRSTPDQVLDLMEKFQAESDDGYLTWTQAKQFFSCLPGSRELFLGGAYTGTERVEKADWYDWFDRARRKYDLSLIHISKTVLGWNPQKTSYAELVRIMAEHDRMLAKREKAVKEAGTQA